jgi:hypothetical protein
VRKDLIMKVWNISITGEEEDALTQLDGLVFPMEQGLAWVDPNFHLSPTFAAHFFPGEVIEFPDGRRFLKAEDGRSFTYSPSGDNLPIDEAKARSYLLDFFPELEGRL